MTALCTSKKFHQVNVAQLHECTVPPSTTTYEPVPHGLYYDMVNTALRQRGFHNVDEDLRINDTGEEFFGILKLSSPDHANSPWDLSLGLRNTNNKRASAGLFLGTNVWVCDNLQFSAEHTFLRKHHAGTIGVLGGGIVQVLGHLSAYRQQQREFVSDLQRWVMTPQYRDHLLVDLLRAGAIKGGDVLPIVDEFLSPSEDNPEAQYDSGWGLLNSVTWIGKKGFTKNPETQAKRSIAANNVFESAMASALATTPNGRQYR